MIAEVELRRVLHHEHHRMLGHPPRRLTPMRLQNPLRRHRLGLKQAIRRQRVSPTPTRPVDTRLRVRRQSLQHGHAPPIQSLVSQINSQQLRPNPFAHRAAPGNIGSPKLP